MFIQLPNRDSHYRRFEHCRLEYNTSLQGSLLTWFSQYFFFFKNWDSLHARLNSHYKAWSYKKKKHKKIKAWKKSVQIKPIVKRCLLILDLNQRIPELNSARKETVDIDILVTSRDGDRKSMQSIRIRSRPPSRIRKWNQLIQFRWTSTKVIPIEKT